MTYVRANGTLVVSDCPGAAPTGTGALGQAPMWIEGASADSGLDGLGRFLGDIVAGTDTGSVAELKRQINRFLEPTTPPQFRLSTAGPLPVTDALDLTTAIYLQAIVIRRATGSSFAGLPELQQQLLESAHKLTDLNWVVQNLKPATEIVKGYADANGLAPAKASVLSVLDGLSPTVKIIGALAVGALIFGGLKKKRGR